MTESFNRAPLRILAVIVLYRMSAKESVAFRTLRAAISNLRDGQAEVNILLYDNTPGGQDHSTLPVGVQFKADPCNGGLSAACNHALELAEKEGDTWLLSLNQDTTLPDDFLCKLCDTISLVAAIDGVAAIAPCVSDCGRVVSPFTHQKRSWAFMRNIPDGFVGIPAGQVYAINSAFTMKVDVLRMIGGYDRRFTLDFCDLVISHRLQRHKYRVYVAGNIHVEHELSVFDLANRVTPGRYEAIQRAEEAFYDEFLGTFDRAVLLLRLVNRLTYKLWRRGAASPYFLIGLKMLCRRLFYSREKRIKSWNQLAGPARGVTEVRRPERAV